MFKPLSNIPIRTVNRILNKPMHSDRISLNKSNKAKIERLDTANCPYCNTEHIVNENDEGDKIECRKCSKKFVLEKW